MSEERKPFVTPGMAVRMLADAIMLNAALFIALVLRFIFMMQYERDQITRQFSLTEYVYGYLPSFALATLLCVGVFYLFGFYTFGRGYRGRYKALIIAQAVSATFLAFGFFALFVPSILSFPRSAIVIAWLLCLGMTLGSRLWSGFWKTLAAQEEKLLRKTKEKVEHVLVIGGAGYIGSALLPKLLERGYKVRLLDVFIFGRAPIADVERHPNLEIVEADFRQVDKIVEAMQGVDAVVHLGGLVGDPACALNEGLTVEINLVATRMIAEVAKASGVNRFVFASTCSVYGASDELLDEQSALNPVSLYAKSKIASERVLVDMAGPSFAPTMLRFATIFGLSGRTRFDLVVNLLTAKAVVEGKITVFGGSQWRPFVHVDDAALAVDAVLAAPIESVRNEVFNVGSDGQNYTIEDVGKIVKELVPTAELVLSGVDGDKRNYRVDFRKIHRTLNYTPKWTVRQGVQQVMFALASGQIGDYRAAMYSNVKFLTEEAPGILGTQSEWARKVMTEAAPAPKAS